MWIGRDLWASRSPRRWLGTPRYAWENWRTHGVRMAADRDGVSMRCRTPPIDFVAALPDDAPMALRRAAYYLGGDRRALYAWKTGTALTHL